MTNFILSDGFAIVAELKKNPMLSVATREGFSMVISNRSESVFYCVPVRDCAALMDYLEDLELNAIVDSRKGQATVRVSLDDL
jgi:antitoxin StbD